MKRLGKTAEDNCDVGKTRTWAERVGEKLI
jgi:hypothetical protein